MKPILESSRTMFSRRQFLVWGAVGAAGLAVLRTAVAAGDDGKARYVYVGTYTRGAPGGDSGAKSNGVYVFRVDPGKGALTLIQTVTSDNPSFVCLDPKQRHLFVVNETDDYQGQKHGAVESYRIDSATGKLTLLNRVSSRGAWPCHVNVDPTGRFLLIANYGGGNYAVAPILKDGRLAEVSGEHQNTGTGPNTARQEASHPHCVEFDRTRRYIATADLGMDKVQIFRLDTTAGKLILADEATVAPGAGPRHVAFHTNGRYLYVINELAATITVFAYNDGKVGNEIQTIGTVPGDFPPHKSTAEIMVHPSGKFLYGSNRKFEDHPLADALVAYSIDQSTGRLTLIGHTTQDIQFPRHFNIEPSGKWLYACNQKGDSIVQFAIDPQTGQLSATGEVAKVPVPVAMAVKTA